MSVLSTVLSLEVPGTLSTWVWMWFRWREELGNFLTCDVLWRTERDSEYREP